jgi:nitrogen fixation NifU-like protein
MNDLRELYQTTILDHNRNPRNAERPEGATCEARGDNPLCGDQVTMYATIENGAIRDVGFEGSGCAISTAAASMLTERVKGMSVEEFSKLFDRYHELLTTPHGVETDASELGKLAVFEGVREFPMRVKCATLAWHTLRSALAGGDSVSTE